MKKILMAAFVALGMVFANGRRLFFVADFHQMNFVRINFQADFLPDFGIVIIFDLEQMDLSGVKMMWTNYPNMPTGGNATPALYERIVDFGRRHGILICNDNLSSLYHHPTDFLANPASLSALALWPLVSLLCATEIASYFLWRRKARRTADEEGRFTPTRGHRCLWLTIDLLSDACLISLFFSVSPRIALYTQ